jgi:hypothetical protein
MTKEMNLNDRILAVIKEVGRPISQDDVTACLALEDAIAASQTILAGVRRGTIEAVFHREGDANRLDLRNYSFKLGDPVLPN